MLLYYYKLLNNITTSILLAVIAIGLSAMPALAESETLSPLQQFSSRIPINEIQCNGSKILMESPRNTPACVNENTAKKLESYGWEIIQSDFQLTPSKIVNSEISSSDKKISMTNIGKEIGTGELGSYEPFWPQYTLTFPEEVRVGESFNVVLDYSFIVPSDGDDEFGVDFEDYEDSEFECPVERCGEYSIFIHHPTYVKLLNRPDYISDGVGTDTTHFPRTFETGSVQPMYDNTSPQQEIFSFVINQPNVDYNYGEIYVTYIPSSDERIYYYIAPDNIVHLSEDPVYMIGEGPSQLGQYHELMIVHNEDSYSPPTYDALAKYLIDSYPEVPDNYEGWLSRQSILDEDYITGFFEAYPGFAGTSPYKEGFFEQHSYLIVEEPYQDSDYISDRQWEDLLEFLQSSYPDQSVEVSMRDMGLDDEFIQKFLDKFEDRLRTQSFFPPLYWSLSLAYGTGGDSLIFGNLKYEDIDGNIDWLSGVEICLYDMEGRIHTATH